MKKVIVTGGTGFIGRSLVAELRKLDYEVLIISQRQSAQNAITLDLAKAEPPSEFFEGVTGVIHLAGSNIFRRWNKRVKQRIYDSRILSTRNLISAIEKTKHKPEVFISASASGYYGNTGEEAAIETTQEGQDFLAHVCVDWEKESRKAEEFGLRAVQVRTSPVLGRGGMLSTLVPLYQAWLGGGLSNGRHWFSWIDHDDIVAVYVFCLKHDQLHGPVNACSPNPVRYDEFATALAQTLDRPLFWNFPRWSLYLILGEFSKIVLTNQRILPQKLLDAGFRFQFPELKKSLEKCVS